MNAHDSGEVPEELQLADALTRLALLLLGEKTLKRDLEQLARLVCRLVSGCSGASVSMIVDGRPSTVATTDRVTLQLDMVQYDHDEGPCIAALGGEAVRIGFLPADERFPNFAIGAADRRVLSVLSTPVEHQGDVIGSLNIYSREEQAFDKEDSSVAFVIASEIANALAKSSVLGEARDLREQLQRRHDSSVLVAEAQGVLMAIQRCSADQAARLIRRAADDNDEPMVVTAQRILESVDGGLAARGQLDEAAVPTATEPDV
jgi:GAF domain-containing protein